MKHFVDNFSNICASCANIYLHASKTNRDRDEGKEEGRRGFDLVAFCRLKTFEIEISIRYKMLGRIENREKDFGAHPFDRNA